MNSVPKLLINGAGGWLGTSTVKYFLDSPLYKEYELILLTSDGRNLIFNNENFKTSRIMDFEVQSISNVIGIVNLAFLTKDKVNRIPLDSYVSTNESLMVKFTEFMVNLQPKWITTVSSGAAAMFSSTLEDDPYGFLKLQEESLVAKLSSELGSDYSIGRLWGAMGIDMPINRNYAISDFICQAIENSSIEIKASHSVYRQYCDSRTFMETSIRAAEIGFNGSFDSGGFVTEIGALAEMVAAQLGVEEVLRKTGNSNEIDEYLPKQNNYSELQRRLVITAESELENLIEQTIFSHKLQLSH